MARLRNWQDDVNDFHKALEIPTAIDDDQDVKIRRPELRAELLAEEACECLEAMTGQAWKIAPEMMGGSGEPDIVEAVDGIIDIIVVACGAACEWGIDLQPIWEEIHRTNMAKQGGPTRKDGKKLKPEGWKPPNVKGLIEAQQQSKEELRQWAARRREELG